MQCDVVREISMCLQASQGSINRPLTCLLYERQSRSPAPGRALKRPCRTEPPCDCHSVELIFAQWFETVLILTLVRHSIKKCRMTYCLVLEKTTCARLLIVGGRDTNFLTVTQLSAHWSCRVRVAEVGDVSRFHSELGSE